MLDIAKLTEEEKAKLLETLKQEEEEKKNKIRLERETYKELVETTTKEAFMKLHVLSGLIKETKQEIFDMFSSVIELKENLFNVKDEQRSHTFTTSEGISITLGYRIVDNFDDTVHIGIAKIKKWVYGLADGNKKNEMKAVIDILLKKDKNGNLKASRVLELRKLAEKVKDPEFSDGVNIIEKAYKPLKSSYFIDAYCKDKYGKRVNIPLSISSVALE